MSQPANTINVVGLDPSLRNWGIAQGTYDLDKDKLIIKNIEVINPVLPTGKQVRQNSSDVIASTQLFKQSLDAVSNSQFTFAEVPVGSQSSRAQTSYGICVGIIGSLKASGFPILEVTPTEVKMATVGLKTATKDQMIQWAMKAHPEANWPTYTRKGASLVSETKAEHMADAIASIYAGLNTIAFQQYKQYICK